MNKNIVSKAAGVFNKPNIVSKFNFNSSPRPSPLQSIFQTKFTNNPTFQKRFEKEQVFRIIDQEGNRTTSSYKSAYQPSKDTIYNVFDKMVTINTADKILNAAQRQSQISFYMTGLGQQGSIMGSFSALQLDDWVFPQYRQHGGLLWRGWSLSDYTNQLTGNIHDKGKGKQMPVHYGDRSLNYVTVSSPLATQIPQASGAGYKFRIDNAQKIAVTYFGDGSSSQGDFHAAVNFAGTLRSQTLFYCRNNMYAISTPIDDQYSGESLAARGRIFGINSLKVDGNDAVAVHVAVKMARELILKNKQPAMIEALSYRGGDHSTSDFSQMYRTEEEMKKWNQLLRKIGDPIERLGDFIKKEYGDDVSKRREDLVKKATSDVREALKKSIGQKLQPLSGLFEDVYEKKPQILEEQEKELREHLEKYKDRYDLDKYSEV